jgi:2-hydroxychromene-2-carboxylate isomerase
MGTVISMADWRARRRSPRFAGARLDRRDVRPVFFFDLASPWTYLAAERADRLLPDLRWRPASSVELPRSAADPRDLVVRAAVERRAVELGLPVAWPDGRSVARGAMRIATLADESGRAAPFVLAAARLAFCGGYDLDDPEILAEAAAAADLDLEQALRAGGQLARDDDMERAARWLLRLGAGELPAVILDRLVFAGERRLGEAVAAAAGPIEHRRHRRALRW